MVSFIEALAKQRLWYWLEKTKGWNVDGEVTLETGRIDLLAESSDGQIIGVELKSESEFGLDRRLYDQTHRYIDSGYLDKLYFASPDASKLANSNSANPVDEMTIRATGYRLATGIDQGWYTMSEAIESTREKISEKFLSRNLGHQTVEGLLREILTRSPDRNEPIEMDRAIQKLRQAKLPPELGFIHIPLTLDDSQSETKDSLLPDSSLTPNILRDARQLPSESDVSMNISRTEEPWVRHRTWIHFGGIPEAHIPNDLDSDDPSRPIDLLAFDGSIDPSDAVSDPDSNILIGVEVKGEGSFKGSRKIDQLRQFLKTETLSKLYLAVPEIISEKAVSTIRSNDLSQVGILSINKQGNVEIKKEAKRMIPYYDGYLNNTKEEKVGYGDMDLRWLKPISNPYLTKEEAERLDNSDPESYAQSLIQESEPYFNSRDCIHIDDWDPLDRTEDQVSKERVRYYLLRGKKAGPYLMDFQTEPDEMMSGYTRLALEWFEDTPEEGLKLNFGGGSWVGGYIWFQEPVIQKLLNVLLNIDKLEEAIIQGQGKVLDLETFPFRGNSDHLRLEGRFGEEVVHELQIKNISKDGSDEVLKMNIGKRKKSGATVRLTYIQLYDLISTLHILLNGGSYRELPGEYGSTPRIGPSGENTWDYGTDIEETSTPPSL